MSTRTKEDSEKYYEQASARERLANEQAAARERLANKRVSKNTRYDAIDIIQDELSKLPEAEWSVREFAEKCIRRIHNINARDPEE